MPSVGLWRACSWMHKYGLITGYVLCMDRCMLTTGYAICMDRCMLTTGYAVCMDRCMLTTGYAFCMDRCMLTTGYAVCMDRCMLTTGYALCWLGIKHQVLLTYLCPLLGCDGSAAGWQDEAARLWVWQRGSPLQSPLRPLHLGRHATHGALCTVQGECVRVRISVCALVFINGCLIYFFSLCVVSTQEMFTSFVLGTKWRLCFFVNFRYWLLMLYVHTVLVF